MDSSLKFEAKRKILVMLLAANLFLLCLGWIVAFYAYPLLPQEMPLWLSFFRQEVIKVEKSPIFFAYPLVQTLFITGFWILSRSGFSKAKLFVQPDENLSQRQKTLYSNLMKELVSLTLIFFNLIFIHIERSLILLAHGVEKGVMELYFYSLFGMILILIPLYQMRAKMLIRTEK